MDDRELQIAMCRVMPSVTYSISRWKSKGKNVITETVAALELALL